MALPCALLAFLLFAPSEDFFAQGLKALDANDPVAAWGGVKLLRERFGIEPCVVTGPSTDNQVGVEIITTQLGVPAFNAITNGAALGDRVIEAIGVKAPQ